MAKIAFSIVKYIYFALESILIPFEQDFACL